MQWLASLGFTVVESKVVTGDTILDAVEYFREHIEGNDIASDGLVLTFDSISYSQSLGRTAKFPKDSIACLLYTSSPSGKTMGLFFSKRWRKSCAGYL